MAIQRIPGGQRLKNTCLCLGNFDGIHLGHRAIVEACLRDAKELGLTSVVWTFFRHPEEVLSGKSDGGGNILSEDDKADLLNEMGVEVLLEEDFLRVHDLSPAAFCRDILRGELDAKEVICGFNFRFGRRGVGGPEDLRRELEPHGVRVVVMPPVELGGEAVSSTRIRRALQEGALADAAAMLGRPYFIRYPVTVGRKLGRTIGFPTINQVFPGAYVPPRFGVYAVKVRFDGKEYRGVCNVGRRPTVEENGAVTAETHLFDFDGDLYGRTVTVDFYRFLRDERKFASLEELQKQIACDRRKARQVLADG